MCLQCMSVHSLVRQRDHVAWQPSASVLVVARMHTAGAVPLSGVLKMRSACTVAIGYSNKLPSRAVRCMRFRQGALQVQNKAWVLRP